MVKCFFPRNIEVGARVSFTTVHVHAVVHTRKVKPWIETPRYSRFSSRSRKNAPGKNKAAWRLARQRIKTESCKARACKTSPALPPSPTPPTPSPSSPSASTSTLLIYLEFVVCANATKNPLFLAVCREHARGSKRVGGGGGGWVRRNARSAEGVIARAPSAPFPRL